MKVIKQVNFKLPIVLLKILENKELLVVDSNTTVRFLNKEKLDIKSGFKANIKHARYKTSVVSFTSDASNFALTSSNAKETLLYDTATKKSITKFDRHQGEVSCVGIEPKNRYAFSCGDDGKIFALDIKSGKLAFTLPVHVDTVNDIAFSDNAQWLATASYDKKISLFNLAMMTSKHKLKAHAAPVVKLIFLSKHRLCSIDKNANVIIWDIYKGKVISRLQGVHDEITQVTKSPDDRFLFLGSSLGYVLVYDLESYEQLSKKYIKLSSTITSMAFDADHNHLILGTEDGNVLFYNIYEGENHLKALIKAKNYDEIQNFSENNPLLKYTKVYTMVDGIWERTLVLVKQALENDDQKKAILLFKPFKNVPSKNLIMQKTMKEYAEYGKFVHLAKTGKIALAYSLANKHPLYKETKIYKALELKWQKAFVLAQKYSLDPKGKDHAVALLAPYRGISDKTVKIQELFTKGDTYRRFKISLGQKDFKGCFELIKQNPFLKEFPEYTALITYADGLYIKSQKLISEGDTHSALKLLRVLSDFVDFKEDVAELTKVIESKQKFFNAIEEEDTLQAYNILAECEDLLDTEDGQKLQDEWNEDLSKANASAVLGDVKTLNKAFEKYITISSKLMAIGSVYGWCYMVQLENAIAANESQSKIENGIKNYILNFGLEDQILNLYQLFRKKYPKSKLNIELQTKGSLSMWRPSMIVNSILD